MSDRSAESYEREATDKRDKAEKAERRGDTESAAILREEAGYAEEMGRWRRHFS